MTTVTIFQSFYAYEKEIWDFAPPKHQLRIVLAEDVDVEQRKKMQFGNRAQFFIDDGGKIPSVRCRIEKFLYFAAGTPEKLIPPLCEEDVGKSAKYSHITSRTCSAANTHISLPQTFHEFDFVFASSDAETTILEEHIDEILQIMFYATGRMWDGVLRKEFDWGDTNLLLGNLLQSMHVSAPTHGDIVLEKIRKYEISLREALFSKMTGDARWKNLLAQTLTTAILNKYVWPPFNLKFITEKKPCPHVERKKKK
jgi:hypothetical protein